MFKMRKIARELLPLVVIAWATFVILGGALKAVERSGSPDEGAAVSAGLGLCAVTVAAVLGGLVKRVVPKLRSFVLKRRDSVAGFFAPRRPEAYDKPPPGPPPLQISQVLRT